MNLNLRYGEAMQLVLKTLPFLFIRLAVNAALGLALILFYGVVFGLIYLVRAVPLLQIIIFLVSLGVSFGIVNWAKRYFFYLLKAGHIAVMTELMVTGSIPQGQGQIEYGKQQVLSRFKDTSIMFGVDQLVSGVINAFNRTFARVMDLLPIPGINSLSSFIATVVRFAGNYVDEAILARAYLKKEQNVWAVAEEGLVLYGQAWRPILTNAVVLALLSYLSFAVFLVVLGIPAIALGALIGNETISLVLGVGAVIFALLLKWALSDSFVIASVIVTYHRETMNLTPNAEWQHRLEQVSDKFRTIQQRAREHIATPSIPATPSPSAPPVS